MDSLVKVPLDKRQHGVGTSYRPDIDGLRAVAVTAVVLFHAGVPFFSSGFFGVDIFFVISGYLLGHIIWRDTQAGRFSLTDFYARRARRILPALAVVLVFILVAGAFTLSSSEYERVGVSSSYASLAISNIRFWRVINYFTPDAGLDPLLMTWSLGVEEQYYVLFPLALMILSKSRSKAIVFVLVIAVISLTAGLVATHRYPAAAFYLLPFRAWELLAGAALAIKQDVFRLRASGFVANALGAGALVILALSLTMFSESDPLPGWRAIWPVAGTVAAIAARTSQVNTRFLGSKPLTWIGLRSYSWYLWHWPLLAFLRICTPQEPSAWMIAATVVISLTAAHFSLRWIETPFRRITLPSGHVLVRYAALVICLAGSGAAVRLAHGLPWRLSEKAAQVVAEDKGGICVAYAGSAHPNRSAECIAPPRPSQSTIAIVGDSHAGALSPGLRESAQRHGWSTDVLAKAGCPVILGVQSKEPDDPTAVPDCASFTHEALQIVSNDPSVKVVILAGYWDARAGESFEIGLRQTITRLQAAGKAVIVMQDSPAWSADPARYVLTREIGMRRWLASLAGDRGAPMAIAPGQGDRSAYGIAMELRVLFLPLREVFCGATCRFEDRSGVLFTDKHHVSALGARMAIARFENAIFR
ncbi:acyltransferase [Novosphingobium flavum]|uniref:Acyltransferase n=1 Tax=Novosphingobium flavum TaxID=1778672 RepID=A0A7X1FUR8_9SPHN|nr:acyltransferase family protein [Novosphingobium flavum]MBC2667351.1 acyltransferase [Novosphingobium flavum]